MPQFDLRGIKCAKYVNTGGAISYTDKQAVGDAMTANLEMRFAEGRLYAESTLAEFMRKATGGTISLGVKYIKSAAQKLLFGSADKTKSVSYIPVGSTVTATASVSGLSLGAKSQAQYVGVAFYAPDMVDGVLKYTVAFAHKCLFGPPSMTLQTAGDSIVFNTPTTSGEFLADDSSAQDMLDVYTVDDENEAIALVDALLT